MKKIIWSVLLAIGMLGWLSITSEAQNSSVTTAVSLDLTDVVDIHIGSSTGTNTSVAMPSFTTANAYLNGVQSVQNDHLYIIASKGFTIQASSTNLTSGPSPDAAHTISAAGINIAGADGSQGTTNKPSGTTYYSVDLSGTSANFITTSAGTLLYKYKVTYTLGGGARVPFFFNKATGTYTATVTYTIIP